MTIDNFTKNAPFKVIQIVKDGNETFGPFFIWNSVDGIVRMDSYNFLSKVLAAHDYDISVIRVDPEVMKEEKDPLMIADFNILLNNCTSRCTNYHDIKMKAAFRTIWAKRTGEVINI